MTKFQANFIKILRLNYHLTWAEIDKMFQKRYQLKQPFNIKGRVERGDESNGEILCHRAMILLEDDYNEWN